MCYQRKCVGNPLTEDGYALLQVFNLFIKFIFIDFSNFLTLRYEESNDISI